MATKSIIRISDLSLLTNLTGAEEITLSYLTPHKIVASYETTYVGSYQYIFNPETFRYDYKYVETGTIQVPKTYTIKADVYESYRFPLSTINGSNITSVKYDYSSYDFEYVPADNGDHVKIGNAYYIYDTSYETAVNTYITTAQTYTDEIILPSEENGLQGYTLYHVNEDEYTYTGKYVKYDNTYFTKPEMLHYITNTLLADRYNMTGVNTMTLKLDNNTEYQIKAINGSKGITGEKGWKGEDGDKGISAFDYYENANLSTAYSLITNTDNYDYKDPALLSAKFGYILNGKINEYNQVILSDEEYKNSYASNYDADTKYFTFEEDNLIYTNKKYNISYFITIPNYDNNDSSENSDSAE